MRLSVIIPTLNEETRLGRRLGELSRTPGIAEVIVVDGGSGDRTCAIAEEAGVRVFLAPRGRATQMNAGARASRGDVLLFLHADVSLPTDAAQHVERALADDRTVAGAFRTWTVADESATGLAVWRLLLHLADLRSRYSRLPYGDQAIFVRREAFERAGGYPEQPLMEDLELSRRLRRLGRIARVPASVRVSGRRFLESPLRAALLVNLFPLLYRMGVSPRTLERFYGNVR